jgi:hypothetical protein
MPQRRKGRDEARLEPSVAGQGRARGGTQPENSPEQPATQHRCGK